MPKKKREEPDELTRLLLNKIIIIIKTNVRDGTDYAWLLDEKVLKSLAIVDILKDCTEVVFIAYRGRTHGRYVLDLRTFKVKTFYPARVKV
jgi:hypothetical protein